MSPVWHDEPTPCVNEVIQAQYQVQIGRLRGAGGSSIGDDQDVFILAGDGFEGCLKAQHHQPTYFKSI